ncbi:MAG: hypothetical protein NW215_05640 [Hyphomicrobiales bacterium]|nr:hypothetical protein [Hyphomicrobiales bacterium]
MAYQKQRKSDEDDQRRPPPAKPVVIRALRAFKRQYHRYASEAHKQQSKPGENQRTVARWTRNVGVFTIVLSIIAALSACISYLQWREMQRQLAEIRASGEDTRRLIDAASKSAQAAEDTVALNRDNAQRHLRAYLSVEKVWGNLDGSNVTFSVTYRNSGQTPAYEVNAEARFLVAYPGGSVIKMPSEREDALTTIGSGMTLVQLGAIPLPDEQLAIIKDPKAIVVLYGKVTYRDVFNTLHTTSYRFQREKLSDRAWGFVVAPNGNEAD